MSWEENRFIERLSWSIFVGLCILATITLAMFFIKFELFWIIVAALIALCAYIFKSFARLSFEDIKKQQ